MKNILYIAFLIFGSSFAFGQVNLVPNGSFEDTVFCPWGGDNIAAAQNWSTYSLSPDYFNSCATGTDAGVPNNWGGYQEAATGNAYAAVGAYLSPIFGGVNIREYIGCDLLTPLTIGTEYYVSFKVNLSLANFIEANCASNKLGALFSTVPYSFSNPAPINNEPHIYSDSTVTDTVGWTFIYGSFVADSAYSYMALGNFFTDVNTDTLIMDGDVNCKFSYYFIDDICVSSDPLTCDYPVGLEEQFKVPQFRVYPNPFTNHFYVKSESNDSYAITVYNSLGESIYSESNISTLKKKVDLGNFGNSFIVVKINTENSTQYYKLISP